MLTSWLGLLGLIIVLATGVRWFQLIKQVAIPRNRAPYFAVFLLGAGLGLVTVFSDAAWYAKAPGVLAALVGGLMPLLRTLSGQQERPAAVAVGDAMLRFTAPDAEGKEFDSASLAGRPYLLKFFRGHW